MAREAVAKRQMRFYERAKVVRVLQELKVIAMGKEVRSCMIGGGYV